MRVSCGNWEDYVGCKEIYVKGLTFIIFYDILTMLVITRKQVMTDIQLIRLEYLTLINYFI